jgi:hypothetical protein
MRSDTRSALAPRVLPVCRRSTGNPVYEPTTRHGRSSRLASRLLQAFVKESAPQEPCRKDDDPEEKDADIDVLVDADKAGRKVGLDVGRDKRSQETKSKQHNRACQGVDAEAPVLARRAECKDEHEQNDRDARPGEMQGVGKRTASCGQDLARMHRENGDVTQLIFPVYFHSKRKTWTPIIWGFIHAVLSNEASTASGTVMSTNQSFG